MCESKAIHDFYEIVLKRSCPCDTEKHVEYAVGSGVNSKTPTSPDQYYGTATVDTPMGPQPVFVKEDEDEQGPSNPIFPLREETITRREYAPVNQSRESGGIVRGEDLA